MWGAIAGAGLGLIGNLIQGDQQRRMAHDAQRFGSNEAAANRAWQERMSSSAYQRASTDLEKAGLNRILALGSPASSPGGSAASGVMAETTNLADSAVNSALGATRLKKDLQLAREDISKKKTETKLNKKLEEKAEAERLMTAHSSRAIKAGADMKELYAKRYRELMKKYPQALDMEIIKDRINPLKSLPGIGGLK